MQFKGKNIFDLFLAFFFVMVIIASLGYSYKARLIPLVIGLPCLAMTIYRFIIGLRSGKEEGLSGEDALLQEIMGKVDVAVDHKEKKEKLSKEEKRRRFLNISLWILAFTGSTFLFGFLITIPLFTFAYMRFHKEKWVLSLCCAAGLGLGIYFAFVVILKGELYEGFIFRLLGE